MDEENAAIDQCVSIDDRADVRRKDSTLIACTIALLALLLLGAAWSGGFRDADAIDYADAAQVPSRCPPAAAEARSVLADGRMDKREARRLANAVFDSARAYKEGVARIAAARATGTRAPAAVPACSSWTDPDGPTLSSPMFHAYAG